MNKTPPILACALALALAACGPQPSSPSDPDQATSPASAAAPATESKAPDSGIDLAAMDKDAKPGDAFFDYANGRWLKTAEIPADRASTSAFYTAFEKTQQETAEIIRKAAQSDAPAGSNERKIGDYYNAWMNVEAIEKRKLEPLHDQLEAVDGIVSREDLAQVLGSRLLQDVDPINATHFHTENLFGLFVAQGLDDPSHNVAYLLQGGLAMPSRDYYLSDDETMAGYRTRYEAYVAAMLEAADTPQADEAARQVLALETKIAKAQANLVDSEDVHKANNPWTPADYASKAPGLDWTTYFEAAGLDDQEIIGAWQPQAIIGLSALTRSEPLDAWKALLRFHTLDRHAELLPEKFAKLAFAFHQGTLSGVTEQSERWKRAVDATNRDLGMAVGKLYVEQYFPAAAKQQNEAMVHNLIAAFRERLATLEWMTPATREKAAAKLDTLKVAVGYPEHWPSYEGLDIRADDPLGNALRVEQFHTRQQLATLGQPVDRDHWWMTPQLVNAINLPLENELQFPAAILQPPFFDADADPARNYGAIGAVIGHEISHSFDNMGAQFDAEGRLHDWWTPEDMAHFKAASQKLIEQYNGYEALPGLHIDGEQTLGENIADVSGLTVAWAAYQRSLDGKEAPVIDGLTGAQRFFLGFAQVWRTKTRDAALRQSVSTGVHTPGQFRALTVRNLDAWYKAFDVEPGDKLYLAPEQRVQIW